MLSATPSLDFWDRLPAGSQIAGVDEAGRGPLAGPVVAAAVLLGKNIPDGVGDSKKLSAKKREALKVDIRKSCAFGIGVVDVETIDQINIFAATMLAMTLAMERLADAVGAEPELALIDGNLTPEGRLPEWRWPARAIVGGDGIEASIGAASILAKTYRDRIMCEAAREYPQYGWERNKGYGSKDHMTALKEHGPAPLHRRSFGPVARAIAQLEMEL